MDVQGCWKCRPTPQRASLRRRVAERKRAAKAPAQVANGPHGGTAKGFPRVQGDLAFRRQQRGSKARHWAPLFVERSEPKDSLEEGRWDCAGNDTDGTDKAPVAAVWSEGIADSTTSEWMSQSHPTELLEGSARDE